MKSVYTTVITGKKLFYEVKCSMGEAIYIRNTQKTFKKIMHRHLSDLPRPLKNEQKQIHLMPVSNSTLILLRHVHIYAST